MRALIAYASKHSSTEEIAERIGAAMRQAGCTAEVRSASEVDDLSGYDAVVLGSAVYAKRWRPDARRFARRHGRALRELPAWLFSSGRSGGAARGLRARASRRAAPVSCRPGARCRCRLRRCRLRRSPPPRTLGHRGRRACARRGCRVARPKTRATSTPTGTPPRGSATTTGSSGASSSTCAASCRPASRLSRNCM
jgi:hypothetical protein